MLSERLLRRLRPHGARLSRRPARAPLARLAARRPATCSTLLGPLPQLLWGFSQDMHVRRLPGVGAADRAQRQRCATSFDAHRRRCSASAIVAVVLVILLRRWSQATAPQRRALAPVLWSGVVMLVLLAGALGLRRRRRAPARPTSLSTAGLIVFASVPWVFLFGLVRSRVVRAGAVSELLLALGEAPGTGVAALPARRRARRPLARPRVLARGQGQLGRLRRPRGRSCRPTTTRCAPWTAVELEGRRVGAIVHDLDALRGARAAALGRRRRRPGDGERAAAGPAARPRRGAARLARPDRRGRHAGAPPPRAQPARRRPAAARRAVADAAARPEQAPQGSRPRRPSCSPAPRRSSRSRSASCASSRAASTRRSCPTAGSAPALEALAGRAPIAVELADVPAEPLPEAIEAAAYFVVAEALTNVVKYAHAQPGHGEREPRQRPRRGRGRRRRDRRRRSRPRVGPARPRRPGVRARRQPGA